MKTNQVCKLLGITKKAITYYEQQGLIEVEKDENGYRCFNRGHIRLLKEITLYRKLQISTRDISEIIKSDTKQKLLKSIEIEKNQRIRELLNHQDYLNKMINSDLDEGSIDDYLNTINKSDQVDKSFVLNKLLECFPGGLGNIIWAHFSNFEFEIIQSKEQNQAWMQIVSFLDETEVMQGSDKIMDILDDLQDDQVISIHRQLKDDVIKEKMTTEKVKALKNRSNHMKKEIKESFPTIDKELSEFQEKLSKFFGSDGYKVHVIENMKILSKEYRAYHKALLEIKCD